MRAPLPHRSKGPSAIAAASAGVTGPRFGSESGSGSGSESGQEPGPEPEAVAPPISAAAAAFVAELNVTPPDRTTAAAAAAAAAGTAKATPGPAAGPQAEQPRRRLPRAALLAGAGVAGVALIGGALFAVGSSNGGARQAATGAVADDARDSAPRESTPPRPGSSPSPSPSPSADDTSASPSTPATPSAKGSATASPTDARTGPDTPPQPSATHPAAAPPGGDGTHTGSGGSENSISCGSAAGSGAITGYSVCVSSAGFVALQVTFNGSQRFRHAFFNTDGDPSTGYQLPHPSHAALGADYMIENGVLYRSRSTSWKWTKVATHGTQTVSGSTYTWTLPLSALGSPTATQRVVFNAGTDYTPVITFSPK